MGFSIVVDHPDDLSSVSDVIHDCWFDKNEMSFDPDSSILAIKFARELPKQRRVLRSYLLLKKVQIPVAEYVLRIHYVDTYRVSDTAGVGRYDFNKLRYDPAVGEISVLTGVPIEIKVRITKFRIDVQDTGRRLPERTAFTFR